MSDKSNSIPVQSHTNKIETLKKICHALDCSDEENRKFLWNKFISNIYTSGPKPDTKTLNFFTPVLETWVKETTRYAKCTDTLLETFQESLKERPNLLQSTENMSNFFSFRGKIEDYVVYTPKPVRTNDVFLRKIPECAVDTFLPSPSPFGMDYLAHLSQLKFLESWGPTLDALAPAYKASIWRVAKIFKEFGTNHDMTSFRKTIARWSQSPLENLDSIRLLFCAIGYLKNAGVIKHEFFYPTSGDCLYPVFRSECNDSEKKRKRRKRKRSFLEPSKENPVQIDMKIGTPHHERPMNAQKLTQTWPSAFRPVQTMHSKKTATVFPKECGDNWSIPLIPKLPTTDVYQNYVSAPSSKRSKLDTGLAPITWPSPPSHSPSHSPTPTESPYPGVRPTGLAPLFTDPRGGVASDRFPKLPPLMGVCKDSQMSSLPRLAPLFTAPCDVRSWPLPQRSSQLLPNGNGEEFGHNLYHTFGITQAKA